MIFRRDGFLFKLAYHWNVDWREASDKIKPQKTSILKLFLKVIFAVLCAWPFIVISRVLGWVIRIVGFLPALILFGYRPLGPSWRFLSATPGSPILPFGPISWWPKFKQLYVMPGLIVFLFFAGYESSKGLIFLVGQLFGTTTGLWSLAVIFFFFTFFAVYLGVRNTEHWQSFKACIRVYIKAAKNRIPIVEFK